MIFHTWIWLFQYLSYDFSLPLRCVTQGNHAKHKLGAILAQVFPCMYGFSEFLVDDIDLYIIHCMCINFIIQAFLCGKTVIYSTPVKSKYAHPILGTYVLLLPIPQTGTGLRWLRRKLLSSTASPLSFGCTSWRSRPCGCPYQTEPGSWFELARTTHGSLPWWWTSLGRSAWKAWSLDRQRWFRYLHEILERKGCKGRNKTWLTWCMHG